MKNQLLHRIISAGLSLLFIGIMIWLGRNPSLKWLVSSILVYIIIASFYTWRNLVNRGLFTWWQWLRVPLFLLSWSLVYFLIPQNFAQIAFFIASAVLVYFYIATSATKGQQIAWNQYLITLLCLLIGVFGLGFYFLLPGLLFLCVLFGLVGIVTRSVVDVVPHSNNVKWVASLVIALFAVELFWVLQFLPLHYSVLAVIEFNMLYLLWALYYHYLYQSLNKRQIQFNVLLALALSIVVLLATPWSIQ